MLINFHCTVIKVPLLYHRPTPSLIHTDHHTPTLYPSVAELLDIVILFLHKFCSLEEHLSGLLGIPYDSRDNWTWRVHTLTGIAPPLHPSKHSWGQMKPQPLILAYMYALVVYLHYMCMCVCICVYVHGV